MSDGSKKRAHVLKPFKDEGTGKSYKVGDTPMIDAGSFGNYQAAELIEPGVVTGTPKQRVRPSKTASKAKAAPVSAAGTDRS